MEMLPKTPFSAVLSVAALWTFVRYLQMLRVGRKYGAHQYIVVSEETILRLLLPDRTNIPGVVYAGDRTFRAKYREFLRAGKDAYLQVAMTSLRPNVYIADPQAIKIITTQKQRYVKDVDYVDQFIGCYGQSLLMVEGEVWRRHRKETQRAFNELGLLVISMAGFGRRISWDPTDEEIPEGHKLSFSKTLRTVSKNLVVRALIPTWAKNLTKTTRDITSAFSEFGLYLTNMVTCGHKSSEVAIDQLQDEPQVQLAPDSLLTLLLSANHENAKNGRKGLDDREVAGEIAAKDSVISVARNGPGANENLREDFFIPKDTNIWLSITAVHYNPTYWPEPEKFRPKRFMEPYNKDAFLAFSTGPRSCVGRRFAEIEAIVALALLIERYEVEIDEEKFPAIPGESPLEREARFLKPMQQATIVPTRVPLVFKRRH
ncbi:unnamed protein product [Rhizoctonia solani]|uniref:Cytochrome P450 n=1 Tax=Rhizoctonia solani TaxID=456999 RepID=A0A8H2XJD0_9AGAM|nr:unnamed protein product [Rhizoctonia solani]